MKKNIKILVTSVALLISLTGCSDSSGGNTEVETTAVATTEATTTEEITTEVTTTEAITTEIDTTEADDAESKDTELVSYSNEGNNYTLYVDNYVSFVETTTDPTSGVNNKDGLELNYGDTYITIQRFSANNIFFSDVQGFRDYLGDENILPYIVSEDTEIIKNDAVIEWKNQIIRMKNGNTVFVGYLYYFQTEEGFYKATISGSDLELLEHYKNFVDNMTFN